METGRLTREQARQHPQRSVLLRVLGDADGEVQLDESIREAVPGDRWLLCSDGLSGPVTAATIGEVLAGVEDPALAADQLIDLAERAGGPDNITAVVFDVVEDDPTPQMEPQVVGSASVHRERLAADGVSAAPVPATPAAKAAALVAGLEADSEASATSPDSAQEEALAAEAERHRSARRRHRLRTALASLAVLVALVVAGVSGYMWTQTQYYVTTADGKVAIFQGIPQTLGPFPLSHLVQTYTEPALADLDERMLERLEETVAQPSLVEARKYVRETVSARVTEEATATPSPADQMATSDPVEVTPPPTDAATGQ